MTPPPPLAPPALHFLVLDFTITCGIMQFTFECTTDTAVRLTLHLSTETPIIRRIPYIKRGSDFTMSSLTCFVATNTYVQNEAGDTFAHTFTVPIDAYDHMYYWYLTGTHGGVPSHSMSQIFQTQCQEPLGPFLYCYSYMAAAPFTHTRGSCSEYSYCFKPTSTHKITELHLWLSKHPSYYQCPAIICSLYTAYSNGKPASLIGATVTHPLGSLPTSWTEVTIPVDWPTVNAGTLYAFSAMGYKGYPGPYSQYIRSKQNATDICPPPIHYKKRVWYRNCTKLTYGGCNCAGKVFRVTSMSPPHYELWGVP